MPPQKIADWNDADQVLARLGALHRDLAGLELTRDAAVDFAKSTFFDTAKPVVADLDTLGRQLKAFVDERREEMGSARSKRLEHGTVAYRWTAKLTIAGRRVKSAIAWLLDTKKTKYLHVEHKLNREALHEAPGDVLRAIGAKVKKTDQFRYEVDGGSYVVEDDE